MKKPTPSAARGLTQKIQGRLRRLVEANDPRRVPPPHGFRASTREWCETSGEFSPVEAPHLIQRRAPRIVAGINEGVDWEFSSRLQFQSPATFVASLPQGRLAGHAVITPDDFLLADVSIEATVTPDNAAQHSIFQKPFLAPPRHIAGRLVALSAAHCHNSYFHWMFDLLPRLEILRRSGLKLLPDDIFAVNNLALPFQSETLRRLGLTQCIETQTDPYARADAHLQAEILIVPSLPGVMGNMPGWACEFLRREFLPQNGESVKGAKWLYITRRKAAIRRLLNEEAVIEMLIPLGFEVLELENLSFAQQVASFQSAEIVVAPHGAGLTNLVFCDAGTKVVELFSPLYVNGCYWALSEQVSLSYHYLLGRGERPAQDLTHSGGGADYEIDPDKFRALMAAVMA